jgi:hypothetical protein
MPQGMSSICKLGINVSLNIFFLHFQIHSANSEDITHHVYVGFVKFNVILSPILPYIPHCNMSIPANKIEFHIIPLAIMWINFSRTACLGTIQQKQSTASMNICSRAVEVSLSTADRSRRWMRCTHFTKSLLRCQYAPKNVIETLH